MLIELKCVTIVFRRGDICRYVRMTALSMHDKTSANVTRSGTECVNYNEF